MNLYQTRDNKQIYKPKNLKKWHYFTQPFKVF